MRVKQVKRNPVVYGIVGITTMLLAGVALMAQDESQSSKPNSGNAKVELVTWNSTVSGALGASKIKPDPAAQQEESLSIDTPAASVHVQPPTQSALQGEIANPSSGFVPYLSPPTEQDLAAPQSQTELPVPKTSHVELTPPAARYFQPAHSAGEETENQSRRRSRVPARSAKSSVMNPANARNRDLRQIGTSDFTLAAQPAQGTLFSSEPPQTDRAASPVEPFVTDFSPTPIDFNEPYDAGAEMQVYEGKWLNANRRPLIELGKPWYQLGQLKPSATWLGAHNPVSPQFLVYGDYRMAYANFKTGNREHNSQVAFELNMNFDLRLTGTERLTAFVAPVDNGADNTRWLLDDDEVIDNLDFDVDFGMFEGDLGAIVGGFSGQTMPFDLPFAMGVMPMLVQNGVWMEDAITGVAATIPARNSPKLDISNMDITFFAAYDEIDSPAFADSNSAAKMYGVLSFIETLGGYWEVDYAFLEDRDRARDRSYHNIGLAYSRRYGRFISNSVRVIINAGQSTVGGPNTADGALLLIENSLITSRPSSFVPYFNFWAGFDWPQSAARAAAAGGVLRNTGILFEIDGMTEFPTLDASANDTWGGALGLNILTPEWDQQLILEFSFLKTMGDDATRIAIGDQAGLGARYQIPLSNSWILRSDVMYGFLEHTPDVNGARVELRHKF